MIKRLYRIARANIDGLLSNRSGAEAPFSQSEFSTGFEEPPRYENNGPAFQADPLAGHYANLEIPPGSDRKTVRKAWKRQLKKYHPDLHSADPEKVKIATELSQRLTDAYRALDRELSKQG